MYACICEPQVDFVGRKFLPGRNGTAGVRWLDSGIALLVLFSCSSGVIAALVLFLLCFVSRTLALGIVSTLVL